MQLLIPVAAGLEGVVKKQLLSLGYGKAPAENGRIELAGDWADVARLNVFLRSGERVLIKLKEFPAETFDELYDNFYSVPWEEWLALDSKILMDGKSVSSRLAAVKAAGGVAKKAIVRRLADKKRSGRKTLSETGARSVVGFSIYKDRVTVTLDTSGDGLHKRGYRSLAYTAPLKETLAAAIIDLSFYRPETDSEKPFADVFWGSGTLPIEAAMRPVRNAILISDIGNVRRTEFLNGPGKKRRTRNCAAGGCVSAGRIFPPRRFPSQNFTPAAPASDMPWIFPSRICGGFKALFPAAL